MKKALLWLFIIVLVIAFVFYRSRSPRSNLNVEPHAREVIEKAKRR